MSIFRCLGCTVALMLLAAASPAVAQPRQGEPVDLFGPAPAAPPGTTRGAPSPPGPVAGMREETVGAVIYMPLSAAGTSTLRSVRSATPGPQRLRIALPNGGSVVCTFTSQTRPGGAVVMSGIADSTNATDRCNLVVEDGRITGDIDVVAGRFRILPVGPGDTHAVVEVKGQGFPSESQPVVVPPPPAPGRRSAIPPTPFCDAKPEAGQPAKVLGPIRVMIVYTPAARQDSRGQRDILADIEILMTQLKDAFRTTGGNYTVLAELAHAAEVDYTEEESMMLDLHRLTNTQDPVIAGIHALRETHRAHLVHLLMKHRPESRSCGIGFLNRDGTPVPPGRAFSVSDRQCAVNNYSFVHELGHNLGMEHDDCATQRRPGAFNYGYAAEPQGVRTAMAYPCACPAGNCRRLGFFSTPNLKFNDVPLGRGMDDPLPSYNGEILCRAASIVSTYY